MAFAQGYLWPQNYTRIRHEYSTKPDGNMDISKLKRIKEVRDIKPELTSGTDSIKRMDEPLSCDETYFCFRSDVAKCH